MNYREPNTLTYPDLVRRALTKPSGMLREGVMPRAYYSWLHVGEKLHAEAGVPSGTTADWAGRMSEVLRLARIESAE